MCADAHRKPIVLLDRIQVCSEVFLLDAIEIQLKTVPGQPS